MNELRDLDFPPTLTRIGIGKPIGTASFPVDLIPKHFGEMRSRKKGERFSPKMSAVASKCRRIVFLKNKTWAHAFLYFLARERLRHLQDVEKIERDMADLCNEWGLHPPRVKDLTWITTKRKP